jgi:hypothetical protein
MNKSLEQFGPGWRPVTWPPEKIAAVEEALKTNPARSDLLVAKLTNSSKASVLRLRNAMVAEGAIPFIKPRDRTATEDDRLCTIKHKVKKAVNGHGYKSHPLIGRGDKRAIKVPEGKTLSDVLREGIKLEAELMEGNKNVNLYEVAQAIGLSRRPYAQGRIVVMLADNTNLSEEDKAVVQNALKILDETNSTTAPYGLVEHIDKQVWGAGKKIHRNTANIKKHAEGFETNIEVIGEICARAADAEIPALSKEAVLSAMEQLEEAMSMLREIYINLGNLNRRKDNG